MTIYLDEVFVFNLIYDYLLLLLTARISGAVIKRLRLLAGALLGAIYACAVFFPQCAFLHCAAMKLLAGAAILLVSFYREEKLAKKLCIFAFLSVTVAGAITAAGNMFGVPVTVGDILYVPLDIKIIAIATAAIYFILRYVAYPIISIGGVGGELVSAEISAFGNSVSITAMYDSGNTLKDAISGRAVLIADAKEILDIFPMSVKGILISDELKNPSEIMQLLHFCGFGDKFMLVPYRSVGVEGGMLLALRSDFVCVGNEKYLSTLVALSPTSLSDGGGYCALWGGNT